MLKLFKPIWLIVHTFLLLSVAGLSVDYYDPTLITYEIPEYVRQFTIFGVFGLSLAWVFFHVIGGSLFGMAAGGVWDGARMGLMLGVGIAFCRLWTYLIAWAVGGFAASAPVWHMVCAVVLAVILFGLSQFMHYFWGHVQSAHSNQ